MTRRAITSFDILSPEEKAKGTSAAEIIERDRLRNEAVLRARLGHLGGNPHFHPPPHIPAVDVAHGISLGHPPGSGK